MSPEEEAQAIAEDIVGAIEAEREPYPEWSKNARRKYRDMVARPIAAALKAREAATWQEAATHVREYWLAAYPLDVFPQPPLPPADCARDLIAAEMGRHMATRLIETFESAAAQQKGSE